MPGKARKISSVPQHAEETIERFFTAAFGPAPELYQFVSCCGWRPIGIHSRQGAWFAEIFKSLSEHALKETW
jgi:hypothetical protein